MQYDDKRAWIIHIGVHVNPNKWVFRKWKSTSNPNTTQMIQIALDKSSYDHTYGKIY